MSRNSLGTVVECVESAEVDVPAPASLPSPAEETPAPPQSTSLASCGVGVVEMDEEAKCVRLAEQLLLIEKQTKIEEEMSTRERHTKASSRSATAAKSAAKEAERAQRPGPFGISRINLISFLNNIATPSAPSSRHTPSVAKRKSISVEKSLRLVAISSFFIYDNESDFCL